MGLNFAAPNNSLYLCKSAFHDDADKGAFVREKYQRDRDRIIHSRAFRRLMHKTQIFNANTGDHYRNRLTHTLEVSQIARSIGKELRLNDELLEAIALGHDLGHTPFGHIGERTLNDLLSIKCIDEVDPIGEGFKHNYQSLRIVDNLENRCNEYSGLNLSLAVRDGILKHTKTIMKATGTPVKYSCLDFSNMKLDQPAMTLEGQVVAIADEIAQCTHDVEDGVRSGIIEFEQLQKEELIQKVISEWAINIDCSTKTPTYETRNKIIKTLVGYLINDVIKATQEKLEKDQIVPPTFNDEEDVFRAQLVCFSMENAMLVKQLNDKIKLWVLNSQRIAQADAKAEYIIKQLFKAYYVHPKELPDYILSRYYSYVGLSLNRNQIDEPALRSDPAFSRAICDHIAGMTDQYAAREYMGLYYPDFAGV